MKTYNTCRCCNNELMVPWLSLPPSPVANALFHEPNYDRYPLDLIYCKNCNHIQLTSAPDPDGVFTEYRYKSGVSNFFVKHFEEYAETVSKQLPAGKMLEIGSNDGYLTQQFKNLGWDATGVEPSEFLRQDHLDKGVPVITGFFGTTLVEDQAWENQFDLICANNVLAHIPDTADVAKAISIALKDNGFLVAECGDQMGIINGTNLDNVYHEHIDYYNPYSFSALFRRFGLIVVSVEQVNSHGISFRIVCQKAKVIPTIANLPISMDLALENIADTISKRQTKMQELINGRNFIAYGAAAKAVTALYMLNLVNDNLVGVVDDNELKQNCYFPGTGIKITSPVELDKDALVVITAWNVFEDIKAKLVSRGHRGEIICMQ